MKPLIIITPVLNSKTHVQIDNHIFSYDEAETFLINLSKTIDHEILQLIQEVNLIESEEPINFTSALRISKYCEITKSSFSEVSKILYEFGFEAFNKNTKIDFSTLNILEHRVKYNKRAYQVDGKIEKISYLSNKKSSIPSALNELSLIKSNQSDENILISLVEKNHFEKIQNLLEFRNRKLDSYFSDKEAVEICSKMSDGFSRNLVKNYILHPDSELRFYIHERANKALIEFGGFLLSFIYDLPKLKQSALPKHHLKNFYTSDEILFPILKIQNSNSRDTLFLKINNQNTNYKSLSINVYKKYSDKYKEIGQINSEGKLLAKLKSKIHFDFFTNNKNDGIFKIFAGTETGKCIICERELTAPFSVNNGIGPECAKKIGYEISDSLLNTIH